MDANDVFLSADFGSIVSALRVDAKMSQEDLAAHLNRHKTYVSRLESGKITCSVEDVEAICVAVRCDSARREILFASFADKLIPDVLKPSVEDMISMLEGVIKAARSLREQGNPRNAHTLASSQLKSTLPQVRSRTAEELHETPLAGQLSELILELVKSALDYMPGAQVRSGVLKRGIAIQSQIIKVNDDPILPLIYSMSSEAVLYSTGLYDSAHILGLDLIRTLPDFSPEWSAEIVRAVAINSGLVGDLNGLDLAFEAYRRVESVLLREQKAFVLEGLARGAAPLRPNDAQMWIEEADEQYGGSGDISPIRRIQLVRARAIAEAGRSGRALSKETKSQVEAALEICLVHEFSKYELELRQHVL